MKSIIGLLLLSILAYSANSRSIKPIDGIQMFLTMGKYAFDTVENGVVQLIIRRKENDNEKEEVFEFDPATLKPGSTHFQYQKDIKEYTLDGIDYINATFHLNKRSSNDKVDPNVFVTFHHCSVSTFNKTTKQYNLKYFYPLDFQQKVHENERILLKTPEKN